MSFICSEASTCLPIKVTNRSSSLSEPGVVYGTRHRPAFWSWRSLLCTDIRFDTVVTLDVSRPTSWTRCCPARRGAAGCRTHPCGCPPPPATPGTPPRPRGGVAVPVLPCVGTLPSILSRFKPDPGMRQSGIRPCWLETYQKTFVSLHSCFFAFHIFFLLKFKRARKARFNFAYILRIPFTAE